MKRFKLAGFYVAILFLLQASTLLYSQKKSVEKEFSSYLFVYFTGNAKSEEAIRFAISNDGYHFRALNHNKPVISSEKISSTGGVRDPHILRGEDGKTFYMVFCIYPFFVIVTQLVLVLNSFRL